MATTTISVASFQTACAEIADAVAAGDWAGAWRWLARAEAINGGLELMAQSGADSLRRRESLAGLRDALKDAEAAVARGSDASRFVLIRTGYPS